MVESEGPEGGDDIRRNFWNTFEAVYVDKNAVARRLFEIKKTTKPTGHVQNARVAGRRR